MNLNLHNWNPRAAIVVMLAATLCLFVLVFIVAAAIKPAGSITEGARQDVKEILIGLVDFFLAD